MPQPRQPKARKYRESDTDYGKVHINGKDGVSWKTLAGVTKWVLPILAALFAGAMFYARVDERDKVRREYEQKNPPAIERPAPGPEQEPETEPEHDQARGPSRRRPRSQNSNRAPNSAGKKAPR
jgi:hypothetical protein